MLQQKPQHRRISPLDAETQKFLLPTVVAGGQFGRFRCKTEELGIHLREILVNHGYPAAKAARYTSHSVEAGDFLVAIKSGRL